MERSIAGVEPLTRATATAYCTVHDAGIQRVSDMTRVQHHTFPEFFYGYTHTHMRMMRCVCAARMRFASSH